MALFLLSYRYSESTSEGESPCRSLWVGNINPEVVSERHLLQLFSRCGRVDTVRILPKRYCAFVNYDQHDSAAAALEKLQVTKLNITCLRNGTVSRDIWDQCYKWYWYFKIHQSVIKRKGCFGSLRYHQVLFIPKTLVFIYATSNIL